MVLILVGIVLGILALVAGIAVFLWRRKSMSPAERKPDYRALFILGICFLPIGFPIGIATGNPGMFGISALGVVYIALGLAHKDEWKKPL